MEILRRGREWNVCLVWEWIGATDEMHGQTRETKAKKKKNNVGSFGLRTNTKSIRQTFVVCLYSNVAGPDWLHVCSALFPFHALLIFAFCVHSMHRGSCWKEMTSVSVLLCSNEVFRHGRWGGGRGGHGVSTERSTDCGNGSALTHSVGGN